MPILTLAFLFRDNKILLAMKKRGFGTGKWNGYGGKLLEGETHTDAIIREIKEESGLVVLPDDLQEIGFLDFYFNDKEEWNQSVIIYKVDQFDGEPTETEEMKPEWFSFDEIPYADMWAGDDQWIPHLINDKKFKGEIRFDEKGTKVVNCDIE